MKYKLRFQADNSEHIFNSEKEIKKAVDSFGVCYLVAIGYEFGRSVPYVQLAASSQPKIYKFSGNYYITPFGEPSITWSTFDDIKLSVTDRSTCVDDFEREFGTPIVKGRDFLFDATDEIPGCALSTRALRSGLFSVDNISIGMPIDQSEYQLVGGIWTDDEGNINIVGMKWFGNCYAPDFPYDTDIKIKDVKQIGIKIK